MSGEFRKTWNDKDRDWHIKGIYYVALPLFLWVVLVAFLAVLAINTSEAGPDPNALTWSLTVLEIVLALFATTLGVVAVFGYWAVRGAAVAAAKKEARLYLDQKAADLFSDVIALRQNAETDEEPEIPDTLDENSVMSRAREERSDD
jgi:hypothetical protein